MFLLITICLFAQSQVLIPPFEDKYCESVKALESGKLDIDYQEFRFSFLKSEQFKIASKNSKDLSALKVRLYEEMNKLNYDEIISLSKQILSIDYTNMEAHKILAQTYDMMEDMANAQKYSDIEMGLLKSIVQNGDGKSCATAWPVIQVSEEYFVLQMLGVDLEKQSIISGAKLCDMMEVLDGDQKMTYYFDITKLFESRASLVD